MINWLIGDMLVLALLSFLCDVPGSVRFLKGLQDKKQATNRFPERMPVCYFCTYRK